jgi:hypothetical protein
MKNLIIYLILAFTVAGCGKQAESIASKTNWTLVAQGEGNKTRWYIDFDSMNIKSPGIFSYKELYDSDEPFEAIRNDGRNVKSIVEQKLINCTDGTTKGGEFTAYLQNMANGSSFTGESKLTMWIGSVPDTPSRKMVIALCQPETRQLLNK